MYWGGASSRLARIEWAAGFAWALVACSEMPAESSSEALAVRPDAAAVDSAGSPALDDCAPGEMACGEVCADLSRDPHHCGNCGVTCPRGQLCQAAHCVDVPSEVQPDHEVTRPMRANRCDLGRADCGDGCQDVSADDANCGRCGRGCSSGSHCVAARCR